MCRENTNMRWQFGGNFELVHEICEGNWKECSLAVINYVWSEIVTEVADFLSNDVLVWKIIAMVVVFIILIHTVYYKLRWRNETSVNKEKLNRVGFKVQDLELKVNILTYKMQYGTWPLPHHMRKSEIGNELHNVRLTLSNSENGNSWIKHLLLSPRNKDNTCNKNLSDSMKNMSKLINLETKYLSSKFQNNVSPNESGDKTVKNINENPTRKWKRCKKCFDITLSKQRQISKSENLGLRRRQSSKSICLLKKEKNDSPVMNSNLDSNKSLNMRKKIQNADKIEDSPQVQQENQRQSQDPEEQDQEISESYSDSINTCSDKNLYEESQLERGSSDLSEESDINYNTEMKNEGHSTNVVDFKIERLNNPEMDMKDDSITEIQSSAKSTDNTFFSWTNYNTIENTPRNEIPKCLPPSLNITFLRETLPKASLSKPAKTVLEGSENSHSLVNTQETLQQVRKRLESLHNVLLAYESIDSNKIETSSIFKDRILYKDAKSKKSSKVSFNMDIKENLITDEEILNSSEYEQCESIIQSSSTSISVQSYSNMFSIHREVVVHKPNYNRLDFFDSESEDEKTQSELENGSNISINTFTKIQVESRENLSNYNVNFNIDRITMSQNQNYIPDKMVENYASMDTSEDQISRSSSQDEFSIDENSDNQSTSALLQEALQFKDALVSQLELEKELKMHQRNVIKEQENEYNYRKNSWPKADNYFQAKVLDIINEEQSASSSTEKTSKTLVKINISEEQVFSHLHSEENSKSPLASTSSEYFSFGNLSQSDKVLKELEIGSEKEERNEYETEIHSSNNKRTMNSEISPHELIKRSKYMTDNEKEETENEKESLNVIENFKDEKLRQKVLKKEKFKEKVKNENKKEILKDSEQDFEVQRIEERNSNKFSLIMDSSSDESLTQFIRELANDKVKAAKIFRESKLNLNSAKSEENISAGIEENLLTLQRRPGSFSLAENISKEKLLNIDSNSSKLEFTNSTMEEASPIVSTEINNDFQGEEKNMEYKIEEMKDDKNVNAEFNSSEIIDSRTNFNFDDSKFSSQTEKRNKCIVRIEEEEKNRESDIEVSEKKSAFYLKEEPNKNFDSQSQSNLVSDPNSSLYFTIEASNSDVNLNEKSLTSSTSILKANLKETILEKVNESLTIENQNCENFENLNENPKVKEVMLIDLSEDDIADEKSKPSREIYSKNTNTQRENLNILDGVFAEKIKENICLVPMKIHPINKSETSFPEIEVEDSINENIINCEKPLINVSNKTKISEINKFSESPSLERSMWIAKKTSTISTSGVVKSKPKIRTLIESSRPIEKSLDYSKEICKKSHENRHTESKERQSRAKSNLNLNLGRANSGEQKRSRSFTSPRIMLTSPRNPNNLYNEDGTKSARNSIKNSMEIDKQIYLTSRTSLKSAESQKSSSRSCIPILKTRLENIRKPELRFRSRSPMRGPLTISPGPDERDLKDVKREAKEEKSVSNAKSFGDNTSTGNNLPKEKSQGSKDKTVIYINIMTDQDQSKRKVVDPKKFLELVKDRELKIKNVKKEEKETDFLLKNKELLKNKIQSKFSIQVEQKEREVSVKPSVVDNSTSISDFSEFCNGKQNKNKYQIFQVPEELTKEEYIDLLDSLNQDPDLEQLSKMHNLCSKLGVGFQE